MSGPIAICFAASLLSAPISRRWIDPAGNDTATNEPFDFHYGNESSITWEAGRNAIPSQEDLIAARQTNAAIGALTAALLAVILAKITNLAGGLVGGILLAVNGLQEYLSSTALSDATLGLILVLATLVTMRLVVKPGWFWTIVLGVIFGAGMSAKLSPIALTIGFAAIGLLFLLRRFLVRIPGVRRPINYLAHGQEARTDRLGWMFISLPFIAFAVFVLSYPYVWSKPIGRTQILFDFRTREMKSQARIWPNLKIKDRGDALGTLWHTFQDIYPSSEKLFVWLSDHTPFPAGVPSIDIFLVGWDWCWRLSPSSAPVSPRAWLPHSSCLAGRRPRSSSDYGSISIATTCRFFCSARSASAISSVRRFA